MTMFRSMAILFLVSLVVLPPALARSGSRSGGPDCATAVLIADLPLQTVDADERSALLYMREEEKLARDVYRAMDDLWGLRIFRNIANAEQTHMDTVLALLEKYGIPDPVGDTTLGAFTNPNLQALHDSLVALGSNSLNEALIVGATIEDLDIRDLEVDLARTDNEDVATAFQNLQKGSRNHMRSFIALLEGNGLNYEPQFIPAEDFEAIIESPRERGPVDAAGESLDRTSCRQPGARQNRGRPGRNR